jgi:hypothetical protein
MVKQTRKAILMRSQSLPEGNVLAGGWVNFDILGTYRNVTRTSKKSSRCLMCKASVVFISSVTENKSKDAAKRKTSNFVIRKWPQNCLIYVQHIHNFNSSKLDVIFIVCLTLRSYNIPDKSLVLPVCSHWTLISRKCRTLNSSSYGHIRQGQRAAANYRTAQHIISPAILSLLQEHRFLLYSLTKYTQTKIHLP